MTKLRKAGILIAVFCIAVFYGCAEDGDMSNRIKDEKEGYPWELGTFEEGRL